MSFILDALKKLEEEKAARKNGEINISAEIVRENRQMRRKVGRSVPISAVLVAFGILILLGVSGVFLWHRHADNKQAADVTMRSERMPSAVLEKTGSEQMAPAGPVVPPGRPMAAVTAEPFSPPVESKRRLPAEQVSVQRPEKAELTARSDESPRETSSAKGSGITVSGIAWQDAPAARRAVINGDLVAEGAQVGGATVEEILPTKVRFSSAGRRFSVSISGPLVAK